jgi:microcystin-dependent protein
MPTQLQFRRGTTAQNNAFTGAVGELSVDTDTKNIRIHDGSNAGGVEVIPAGTILAFGSTTLPANSAGYLKCDGSAVSRSTYARLFAVISTSFGTGDGSSTFNVPDLRDRLPLGLGGNNTGLNAATTGAAASSVVTSAQGTGAISGSTAQGTGAISGNTGQATAEVDITSGQTAAGSGNLAVEQHAHGVGNLATAQAAPEVTGNTGQATAEVDITSAQTAVTIAGNTGATTPSFSVSGAGTASIGGKDTSGNISVISGGSVGSHTHGVGNLAGAQHTHAVQGDTAQHAHAVDLAAAQHAHTVSGNTAQATANIAGDTAQHTHAVQGDTAQHAHAVGNLAVAQHTHGAGNLAVAQHTHAHTIPSVVIQYIIKT